jgi:hypothetical protein
VGHMVELQGWLNILDDVWVSSSSSLSLPQEVSMAEFWSIRLGLAVEMY